MALSYVEQQEGVVLINILKYVISILFLICFGSVSSSELKDSILIPEIDNELIEEVTDYVIKGEVIRKIINEGVSSCFTELLLVKVTEVKKGQVKVDSEMLVASVNDMVFSDVVAGKDIYLMDIRDDFYKYCEANKLKPIKRNKIKRILKLQ